MIKKCIVCNSSTGKRGMLSYILDKGFYCEKCNSFLYIETDRKPYWVIYILVVFLSFLAVYSYSMNISIMSLITIFVILMVGYRIGKICQINRVSVLLDGEKRKNVFTIIYILLITLYVLGVVFIFFATQSRIGYFYAVTLIASFVSLWGFFKKNKLIYFIIVPGLFRVFLYLKNEEISIFNTGLHIAMTLIPLITVYYIRKTYLRVNL